MPPILVVGSGKGGTSAVAGILQILGVDMGPALGGVNEDRELWDYNRLPEVIQRRAVRGKMWGWKDVNFVHYRQYIEPHLPLGSRFVVVTRKPERVAASLMRSDYAGQSDATQAIVRAVDWQNKIKQFYEATPSSFMVGDFDEFRKAPDTVIEQLAATG